MAAFEQLAELEKVGARVTAVAIDLSDLAVIGERNADIRLTPASLTKLSIAAASLDAWPADKTFRTRLMSAVPVKDGVLSLVILSVVLLPLSVVRSGKPGCAIAVSMVQV